MTHGDKKSSASVADEIAAAEANYRQAQERLYKARQRAASLEVESSEEVQNADGVEGKISDAFESNAQTEGVRDGAENYSSAHVPNGNANTNGIFVESVYEPKKDHIAAGLLAIFFGSLGIHKFYMGLTGPGFILLGITIIGGILTFGLALTVTSVIGIIEGIIYLTRSQEQFESEYVDTPSPRNWL